MSESQSQSEIQASRRDVEALLHDAHAPRFEAPGLDPAAEAEVLTLWAARHALSDRAAPKRGEPVFAGDAATSRSRAGGGLLGLLAAHRLATVLGALLLAVVAACVMPTSYEVPLGLALEITCAGDDELPVREIVGFVRDRSAAEEVDVIVRKVARDDAEPQLHMAMRLWDQSLALGELEGELREAFPVLADAEIVETPLSGEVETIWGRRLANRAFHLSLREADVEEARMQLLMRLQAEGYEPHEVVVKVRDRPDGHREVEVEVERRIDGEVEGGEVEGGEVEGGEVDGADEDAALDPASLEPPLRWMIEGDEAP